LPGYIVTNTGAATDPDAYGKYAAQAFPTLEQYGGKVLMAGHPVEQLEGDWRPDESIYVLEFESVERAREWYRSPEYSAAKKHREGAISVHQVLVEPAEQG
jgi:uncharacterized protein (DUF1330 family)